MFIELSILPPNVQQQILQITTGEPVHFTNQGEIFAQVLPTKPVIQDDVFGILKNVQGLDGVEFQNQLRNEWTDYANS